MAQFTVTIDHTKVDSSLTDFPVFINLADLPAGFWSTVTSGGGDIRTYQADGTTEIAREVASCDTTAKTGELHVKTDLSSSTDTVIIINVDGIRSEPLVTATYGRNTVWVSYASVYHMSDGTTLSLTDSAGLSDAVNSGVTAGSGVLGGAGVFSSAKYSADLSSTYAPTANAPITISLWLYADSIGSATYATRAINLFKGPGSSSSSVIIMGVNKSNKAYYYDGTGHDFATVSTSTWYHFALTYDGTEFQAYLNGVATGSPTTKSTLVGGDYNLSIGSGLYSYSQPLDGKIDEPRITMSARSADWILTEYNNQSSPSTFYTVTGGTNTTNFFRFF